MEGESREGFLVKEGYKAVWNGDLPAAIGRFRETVSDDSLSPYRWCDLGEAFLLSGDRGQAEYCIQRALELDPKGPPILLRAANLYLELGERSRGLEYLDQVAKESAYPGVLSSYRDRFGSAQDVRPVATLLSNGPITIGNQTLDAAGVIAWPVLREDTIAPGALTTLLVFERGGRVFLDNKVRFQVADWDPAQSSGAPPPFDWDTLSLLKRLTWDVGVYLPSNQQERRFP